MGRNFQTENRRSAIRSGRASTQAEREPGFDSGQPNQGPAWLPLAGPLSEYRRLAKGVKLGAR